MFIFKFFVSAELLFQGVFSLWVSLSNICNKNPLDCVSLNIFGNLKKNICVRQVSRFALNNTAGLQLTVCNLIKKRHQYRCFPVNFAKFIGAFFFRNTSEQLVLYRGHVFLCSLIKLCHEKMIIIRSYLDISWFIILDICRLCFEFWWAFCMKLS